MATGTTLVAFKLGLLELLQARPGLDGVQLAYARPKTLLADEAMWFGPTAEADDVRLAAYGGVVKRVEENYDLDVVIQILAGEELDEADEGVALAADRRAVELLVELQQTLAAAPRTIPDVFKAELRRWRHTSDPLGMAEQGSRFTATVRVLAHLTRA